jgi:hypothetical protein
VTILLPRRAYGPLAQLLHDRTADQIAKAVSRNRGVAATIVPYDVHSRIGEEFPHKLEQRVERRLAEIQARVWRSETATVTAYEHPQRPSAVTAISELVSGRSATIQGRVREVRDVTRRSRTTRSMIVGDDTGQLRVEMGSSAGADIVPGQLLRMTGNICAQDDHRAMTMADPEYHVVG